MKKIVFNILITIILVSVWISCIPHTHDSVVTCDITYDKEYVIKWDVYPAAQGYVKVYISASPDSFDLKGTPVAVIPASDGVVEVPSPNTLNRYYFYLNFNDCFGRVVGARASYIQSAYIFRDLGGYSALGNKKSKWGMIYRAGVLDTLSQRDKQRIQNLNVKTIIEYRDKEECMYSLSELGVENIIYMQPSDFDIDSLINKVHHGEFKRGDARVSMQDFYLSLLTEDSKDSFVKLFDILAEEDNYPIIMTSRYGKGFNDLASLFILSALGVSIDEIYEDYTWANQYFCKTRIIEKVSHLPQDVREAIASIVHNNRKDLLVIVNTIQHKYGSIDKYMIEELKLTKDKREKIQKNLLVVE